MILTRIRTFNFRNLGNSDVELSPNVNLIVGENAQGKTNLLEAVLVATGQPHLSPHKLSDLIRFDSDKAAITASFDSSSEGEKNVKIEISPNSRRVIVDGKSQRGRSVEGLGAVLFRPDDLMLPKGSPSGRRQFLDTAIALSWPRYTQLKTAYGKALTQRNHLLKTSKDASLLDVYERQLAEYGAGLITSRFRFIESLLQPVTDAFARISGQRDEIELIYETHEALEGVDIQKDALCMSLSELLLGSREKDFYRGYTSIGPHTDDLVFLINGRRTNTYASQGQMRSLVLALRVAQMNNFMKSNEIYPMLLLDDVSSELDPKRSTELFNIISENNWQCMITTTRAESLPKLRKSVEFKMVNGALSS